MINNSIEHECALKERLYVKAWLQRLNEKPPKPYPDLNKMSVEKLLARIEDEIAVYESSQATLETAEKREQEINI